MANDKTIVNLVLNYNSNEIKNKDEPKSSKNTYGY